MKNDCSLIDERTPARVCRCEEPLVTVKLLLPIIRTRVEYVSSERAKRKRGGEADEEENDRVFLALARVHLTVAPLSCPRRALFFERRRADWYRRAKSWREIQGLLTTLSLFLFLLSIPNHIPYFTLCVSSIYKARDRRLLPLAQAACALLICFYLTSCSDFLFYDKHVHVETLPNRITRNLNSAFVQG